MATAKQEQRACQRAIQAARDAGKRTAFIQVAGVGMGVNRIAAGDAMRACSAYAAAKVAYVSISDAITGANVQALITAREAAVNHGLLRSESQVRVYNSPYNKLATTLAKEGKFAYIIVDAQNSMNRLVPMRTILELDADFILVHAQPPFDNSLERIFGPRVYTLPSSRMQ